MDEHVLAAESYPFREKAVRIDIEAVVHLFTWHRRIVGTIRQEHLSYPHAWLAIAHEPRTTLPM
jgi:hypothetical protein